MERCAERYLEFGNIPGAKRKTASTRSLEAGNMAESDLEEPGKLPSIAVKVLMNILHVARMARFDLVKPATSLAREVWRWNRAYDKALFRRVCYISTTLNVNLVSHVGDPIDDCRLMLFTD